MQPGVERTGHVAKLCKLGFFLLGHHLLVAVILHHGNDPADACLAIDKPPGEAADGNPLIQKEIDIPTDAFDMDYAAVEHLQMHELVLVVAVKFSQGFSEFLLEEGVRLLCLAGHPVADDGVHGMIGGATVYTDPAQLLLGPFGELPVRDA